MDGAQYKKGILRKKLNLAPRKKSVSELIELTSQLDCGMYSYLSKSWQNPSVVGLCAFRLISDTL